MTTPPWHRRTAAACVAVAAVGALASLVALAGGWDSVPSSSDLITVESLGRPSVLANADGAWVLYAPTLSVDCSPPRGCYAKTQRIHYDFSCSPRYAVMTERISMDLKGTILKQEVLQGPARYVPSYDAGAASVLQTFCPPPPGRE